LAVTGTADRLPPVFASVPDAPTEKVIVPAAEPFSVSDQVNVALWAAARSTPAMHAVCAVGTEAGLAWLVCDTTGTVPTWTEAPPRKERSPARRRRRPSRSARAGWETAGRRVPPCRPHS